MSSLYSVFLHWFILYLILYLNYPLVGRTRHTHCYTTSPAAKDGSGAGSDRVDCLGTQTRNPKLKPKPTRTLIRIKIHPRIRNPRIPETRRIIRNPKYIFTEQQHTTHPGPSPANSRPQHSQLTRRPRRPASNRTNQQQTASRPRAHSLSPSQVQMHQQAGPANHTCRHAGMQPCTVPNGRERMA